MSNIILQPCSSKVARKHFVDTIDNPVDLRSIEHLISAADMNDLREIYPGGFAPIWGVTPGKNNFNKWARVGVGDVALFSWMKYIHSSGVVTYKLQSKQLAAHLWEYDDKGQTWEYIYFLDELREHTISYKDFNRAASYDENYNIQGFSVLSEEKSGNILRTFDLESPLYIENLTPRGFYEILDKLAELEKTDEEIRSKKRLEQGFLKNYLFGRKTIGICGICNKEYPISFLVTAHIKKRAYCSATERKDYNIVMPMCKFGCDQLFENGYISIAKGIVIDLEKKPSSTELLKYKRSVLGERCGYFNDNTEKYFTWHQGHHKGASQTSRALPGFTANR